MASGDCRCKIGSCNDAGGPGCFLGEVPPKWRAAAGMAETMAALGRWPVPPAVMTPVGKPVMVMRSLRVPEALWNAAKAKADERGENISDVLREALERYVRSKR